MFRSMHLRETVLEGWPGAQGSMEGRPKSSYGEQAREEGNQIRLINHLPLNRTMCFWIPLL